MKWNRWNKCSYLWVTLILFIVSIVGHWLFAWYAYVDEQQAHNQPVEVSGYLVEVTRDTLENWQSEFLQLMWQVAGLAFLLFVGSSQSRETEDRIEEKLDLVIKNLYKDGDKKIADLDKKYLRDH